MKKVMLLLLAAWWLSGCQSHDDLNQWINNTKAAASKKVKQPETPTINAMTVYVPPAFVGLNAFDPGRLRVARQSLGASAPDLARPKEILEGFGLEKIEYVGSLTKAGRQQAFVRVDGHVYTVREGNYLGSNFGRIVAIRPDKILLQETVEDLNGAWTVRPAEIMLTTPDAKQENKG